MKRLLLGCLFLSQLGCATSLERLVERSQDKVVKIGVVLADGHGGSGSGVFIDSRGTVLTCAHVVDHIAVTKIFVKLEDGKFYYGVITKLDKKRDLALVKVELTHTPYVKLGPPVIRGQQVLAFGSPLGLVHSTSIGYVENLIKRGLTYIVHGANILPGSSGGPLLDTKGRLVGINEAMLMLNPLVPAPGYYIAIDVEEIESFLRSK